MADVRGTACMWTGLGHEHRPRCDAPVDQRMLIMGPLHTLEATVCTTFYTKASHAQLACASHSAMERIAQTMCRWGFESASAEFLLIAFGEIAGGVTLIVLLCRRANRRGLACTTPCRARARRWSRATHRGRAREHRTGPLVRGSLQRCQQRAATTVAFAEWEVRDWIRRRRSESLVPVHRNDTRLRGGSSRERLGDRRRTDAVF
jgi:hypothetical protein